MGLQVFFSRKQQIYHQYAEFFEYDPKNQPVDSDGVEQDAKVDKKQNTIRFYFNLTYQLAGDDITKMEQIDSISVYLCLNVAALIKERYLKEKEELDKMKRNMK